MAQIDFDPDEVILAELSPSRRSVLFPVLELLLISGLIWLGIGLIDAHFISVATANFGYHFAPPSAVTQQLPNTELEALLWLRRGLLVLWVVLAWRRCIRHIVYRHRSRMILTDRRLITASGHMRSQITSIPLHQIVDARQRGGRVNVYIVGARMPYQLDYVPQAKKLAKMIQQRTRLY